MSNETKWTPGPWLNVGGWVDSEDDSHGSIICSLSAVDRKPDYISDANAHLIAAAPDLYEALDQAVTSMQDSGYPNTHLAVIAARKALAKARGEQ